MAAGGQGRYGIRGRRGLDVACGFDARVEMARALRDGGLSFRRIGERLGVSQWTVRDWCEYRTRTAPPGRAD
jgi:hypothetical protein